MSKPHREATTCEMYNDNQDVCGKQALSELEGGPACASCLEGCKEEGLEILPLGTSRLYQAGQNAFKFHNDFTHTSITDSLLKGVAVMLALSSSEDGS